MKAIINNWKLTDSQPMQYVKCSFKSEEGGEYNHYKLIEMSLRNPDIKEYKVDVVVMGSDWANSDRFEYLRDYCEVVYLDRTEGISTTKIKKDLNLQEPVANVDQIPESIK